MKSVDVKEIYSGDYFLNAVDGFREFYNFDGSFEALYPRYQKNVQLLGLLPGHKLLEIGCGRGEICIYHALRGGVVKGVDYSTSAIKLAREKALSVRAPVEFIVSSFDGLDDPPETYDRILASEFIEHISAEEGTIFFKIVFSMLKPQGKLLVFTAPNTLQRRFGYTIQRVIAALQGRKLPKQQLDTMSEHYKLYHLNEQSFFSLKKSAKQAGFDKIEIGYDADEIVDKSRLKRMLRKVIQSTPLRHIFMANLYLLAER